MYEIQSLAAIALIFDVILYNLLQIGRIVVEIGQKQDFGAASFLKLDVGNTDYDQIGQNAANRDKNGLCDHSGVLDLFLKKDQILDEKYSKYYTYSQNGLECSKNSLSCTVPGLRLLLFFLLQVHFLNLLGSGFEIWNIWG